MCSSLCAGDANGTDGFTPGTLCGAVEKTWANGTERLQSGNKKAIGYSLVVNENLLYTDYNMTNKLYTANIVIHEFGHAIGLIDYYDATYGEINAVGYYDMQAGNVGDWNPYSKFAAGWVEPIVITPEEIEKNSKMEITLKSYANTGDVLVIPVEGTTVTDGKISPFEEYIAVDFFTPDGVNTADVADYGLDNVKGVQIYHINGTSVARELTDEKHNETYTFVSEAYRNVKNDVGKYQVELIQKPGKNTFTGEGELYPILSEMDFFYAGDSFSMKKHDEFFYEGKMDNGTDMNYQINVKSINGDEAVIEIEFVK